MVDGSPAPDAGSTRGPADPSPALGSTDARQDGSARPDQRFPPERRLRKRREFLRLQGRGKRVHGRRFIFHFLPSGAPRSRLGVTVSRKVGNAVVRNRIKRWVREAWRQNTVLHRVRARGETPYDVVVTAKREVDDFSFAAIQDELVHVISRYLEDPGAGHRRKSSRGGSRRR